MNTRSNELATIALQYLNEVRPPGLLCAWVGGSVGRGEADDYSDLDLSLVVEGVKAHSYNQVVWGEIVQVDVTGVMPTQEQIEADPWNYRFLLESAPLLDPHKHLATALAFAREYYNGRGIEAVTEAVFAMVDELKQAAQKSMDSAAPRMAGMAARAALCELAALQVFISTRCVSTMSLFQGLEELCANHGGLDRFWPLTCDGLDSARHTIRRMERLRAWSREQRGADPFTVSLLQDVLMARKGARMIAESQWFGLAWQFYCEAEDMYFNTAGNIAFDHWLDTMPEPLRLDWSALGFRPVNPGLLQDIFNLCAEQMEKC